MAQTKKISLSLNSNKILGMQFGTILALSLSGILAENVSWDSIFYIFGGTAVAWFALWVIFVFDTPAKHPRITNVSISI